MEEDFRALFATAAGVETSWLVHPQGLPLPAIVLNVVDGAETMTMQGPDGLLSARVQVDCYAPTYSQAKTISRAVLALNGHRGAKVRLVAHVSTREGREGGSNEADRPFRVSLDFLIHWRDEG